MNKRITRGFKIDPRENVTIYVRCRRCFCCSALLWREAGPLPRTVRRKLNEEAYLWAVEHKKVCEGRTR
jgi:hypothetical protein